MIHIPGYTVGQKIYEGNKTVIYSGIRLNDDIPVLLKLLHSEYPDLYDVEMLKNEYQKNQTIHSNNVVKIYSIENYEKTPVLILEDFGGESLQKILNMSEDFNLMNFLNIAIQLSQALFDIYKNDIIHKSINPSNIIVNMKTGLLKLTDFGSASLFSVEQNNMDEITNFETTLDYISPEQTGRLSRPIDYRTDFYSLGVVFFEMITGFLPFQADDKLGIIHCHLAVKATSPHEIDASIPQVISDIIMKLMEKMPENRYQSAIGLKYDLERCNELFKTFGYIPNFKIGEHDISSLFEIPNKLYGREKEIEILKSAFERINNSQKEAIMVTGYSGAGKSQLVNTIRNSINKQSGYFISGKFDQFEHDIPYSALIYSFKDLVQQILSENKDQINIWKEKLLSSIGSNSQIIIDIIPEIENIIGKQEQVIEVSPEEAKNRFFKAFQDFVKTFCEVRHPLLLFLDDLQWADLSSLKLLEVLMVDSEINNLLLICSYRYNDIHEMHPVRLFLSNIQKENVLINTIFLKPLKLVDIKNLIAETFHCNLNESDSLAKLSQEKTGGNPFFLSQFLYSLYKDQLIWFNKKDWKWQLDLYNIENAKITDNVIDLITTRMLKLPKFTIEILKLAACIGNQFDLDTLSIICDMKIKDLYINLSVAIKEGMILPTVYTHYSSNKLTNSFKNNYTFLHDRIQQAAYSLIDEKDRKSIHLKIGRLLLSNTDLNQKRGKVLDIVNQLNLGIELVDNSFEKQQIAKLELIAGKITKKCTAYDISYKYLRTGISLIRDQSWEHLYNLTHSLYTEAAEVACLAGDFEAVEHYTEIALNNSTTVLDKVKLYKIKIIAYTAQNKKLEVLDTALFVLKLLGMNFPKNPNSTDILLSVTKTKFTLIGKQPSDLFELPVMTDSFLSACLEIMVKMGISTYMLNPKLFLLITLKAVRLYAKYGNHPSSTIGYAAYGMLLCSIGDIDSGYEFGQLSLKLLDKLPSQQYKAQTLVLFNCFISHRKLSVKNVLIEFIKAYYIGFETGNINYACTSACLYSISAYYSGANLINLEKKMSEYSKVMSNMKNKEALITLSIYHQSVLNLIGFSKNTSYLNGNVYNENKMLLLHINEKDIGTLCSIYINKSILSYMFNKYDEAFKNSERAQKYLLGVSGTLSVPIFYFYNSLIMLSNFDNCSFFKKKQILYKVHQNQKKLKKWAQYAEMNFLHKFYLVKAEESRVLGRTLKAMYFYETSIKLSSNSGYIQDEALANELAAKFYLSIGHKKIATTYMEDALYFYTLWGANAKIDQLKDCYPEILDFYKNKDLTLENESAKSSMILDTQAILKATQTISGEIKLEELLKKLVYILLENAGAQKVFYLIKKEDRYIIRANGNVDGNKIEVMTDIDLESYANLPNRIIYYVERSLDSIILDNAYTSKQYRDEQYIIDKKIKSIMCMPVLSKGNLLGILYLENNLIEGAFNNERIQILKIISSQLAISLDNATLYADLEHSEKQIRHHHNQLEDLVEKRTAKLKEEIIERKKAENLLKEMANHDNLTGLPNRKLFYSKLNNLLEFAKNNKLLLGILFIDLDGFKIINDTFGHNSGDIVLKIISERLLKSVRQYDIVSRFGGDEFIIIMQNPDDTDVIKDVCEKIIKEVGKNIVFDENNGHVTASIGVAIFPTDGDNIGTLIKKADNAMYLAKKSGKNQVIFN